MAARAGFPVPPAPALPAPEPRKEYRPERRPEPRQHEPPPDAFVRAIPPDRRPEAPARIDPPAPFGPMPEGLVAWSNHLAVVVR